MQVSNTKNFTSSFLKVLNGHSVRLANVEDESRRNKADSEADFNNFKSSVGLELVSLKSASGDIGEKVRSMGTHHEVTAMAHRQVAQKSKSVPRESKHFERRLRNVTSALMERIHRVEVEMRNVVGNTTQLQKLSLARCDILDL